MLTATDLGKWNCSECAASLRDSKSAKRSVNDDASDKASTSTDVGDGSSLSEVTSAQKISNSTDKAILRHLQPHPHE